MGLKNMRGVDDRRKIFLESFLFCGEDDGFGNVARVQSHICHFFGEEWNRELQQNPHRPQQVKAMRRKLMTTLSCLHPGILDVTRYGYSQQNVLEAACSRGDIEYAHFLLDIGVRGTTKACGGLRDHMMLRICRELDIGPYTPLMKRLVRRGGALGHTEKVLILCRKYQKQYESICKASWILIGIGKYKESPLIPKGVPIDIIKQIAHYMRRIHEDSDIPI